MTPTTIQLLALHSHTGGIEPLRITGKDQPRALATPVIQSNTREFSANRMPAEVAAIGSAMMVMAHHPDIIIQ